MIHIDFDPSKLSEEDKIWGDSWQAKASEATLEIIQAWEDRRELSSGDFRNTVWK